MDIWITLYNTTCNNSLYVLAAKLTLSRDAVRYAFGPVIQKQLSQLLMERNYHRICKTATAEALSGVPEVLYHLPSEDVSLGVYYDYFSIFMLLQVVLTASMLLMVMF